MENKIDSKNNCNNKKIGIKILLIFLLIFVVVVSFSAGFSYGKSEAKKVADLQARVSLSEFVSGKVKNTETVPKFLSKDVEFDLYWDMWNRIKDSYVDKPVSETKMFYGSLAGMAAAVGDPYTMFFDPEIALKFQQELEGSFEGIGAEIGIKKDRLTVIAPLPETPAEKAGLRPGDQIYYIDTIESANISLEEAVNLIRGPRGTEVLLRVWRENNGDELIDIKIVRDKISLISANWKQIDKNKTNNSNIAYIKIRQFSEDVDQAIDKIAIEAMETKPDGIILDLRNNPGGFLDKSIHVSGKWVKDKVVVKEKTSDGSINEYSAFSKPSFEGVKTVVLINRGSASASEIVAGALQDYGLATVIGETSFGKGSVQDYQSLKDGSALKITVAKWLTPKDRSIQGNGVAPDIKVEMTDKDYEENKDPQLDRAIEFLLTGK